MKICAGCNRENEDNAQFCQYCGRKFSISDAPKPENEKKVPGRIMQKMATGIGVVAILFLIWVVGMVLHYRTLSSNSSGEQTEVRDESFQSQGECESELDSFDWESEADFEEDFDIVDNEDLGDKRRRCLEYMLQQRIRYMDNLPNLSDRNDFVDVWREGARTIYLRGDLIYVEDGGLYYNYKNGEVYSVIVPMEGNQELYFYDEELFCWKENGGGYHFEDWNNRTYRQLAEYWSDAMDEYYRFCYLPDGEYYEDWEYVLPWSAQEYLPEEVLEDMDWQELRIAYYEILARHGRRFDEPDLQEYFDSKSWYDGFIEPSDFDPLMEEFLNDYEEANLNLLMQY